MKKHLFFIGLLAGNMLFAGSFASQVKPLYADFKQDKVIGKLLPTAEVEILQTKGDRVLICIEGYQDEQKPAIYFAAGKRILNAGFDARANIKFEKIGETQVDGKTYNKVKVMVWAQKDNFVDDILPLYTNAKTLFEQNCSMCHSLHSTKEFSANQWPSIFKSMAGRTGIEKKDYQLVIEYLQKHAKDMN